MVIPQYLDSNCQGKLMGSIWYTYYYQLLGWFSWGEPLICQWRKNVYCHFRNLEVPNTSRNFREYPHRRCSGILRIYIYMATWCCPEISTDLWFPMAIAPMVSHQFPTHHSCGRHTWNHLAPLPKLEHPCGAQPTWQGQCNDGSRFLGM